ncbi:hypothetical protein D3C81_1121710 [compost metagenome]
MALANLDAGSVGGDQRQANAQFIVLAQQVLGVVGLERQAQQGGDRAERDVAFFPIQAQADDFFTVPLAFADNAGIRHGTGVGTRQRAGQGEAGNLFATGQARQVVVALFVGAVMQQQFGRAQGVGHHDRGGEVAAAGRELHCHLRVGVGREAFTAVLLGNDQGEETLGLDVRPGFGRQVQVLADLPVADHGAELFCGAVDEGLLFFAQFRRGVVEQGLPGRAAAEEFAIPPHGAGIDGFALGLRHRWQGTPEPREHPCAEHLAPPPWQRDQGHLECQHDPQQCEQPAGGAAESAHQQHVSRDDAEHLQGCQASVREVRRANDKNHQPQQQHNRSSLESGA